MLPHYLVKFITFSPDWRNVAFHHALLKFSSCRNKTFPQLAHIADWYSIHALLQQPNSAVPSSSSLSLQQYYRDVLLMQKLLQSSAALSAKRSCVVVPTAETADWKWWCCCNNKNAWSTQIYVSSFLQPFMPLSPDVSDNFYSLKVTSDQSYDFKLALNS